MLSRTKFLRMMEPKYNYSRKKTPAKLITIMMIGFVWLFACVWFSSQAIRFNYEINKLTVKRDNLRQKNRILELRLQTMTSIEKIGRAAKEKYGFKTPGENQCYVIKEDTGFFEKIIRAVKNTFIKEKKV